MQLFTFSSILPEGSGVPCAFATLCADQAPKWKIGGTVRYGNILYEEHQKRFRPWHGSMSTRTCVELYCTHAPSLLLSLRESAGFEAVVFAFVNLSQPFRTYVCEENLENTMRQIDVIHMLPMHAARNHITPARITESG